MQQPRSGWCEWPTSRGWPRRPLADGRRRRGGGRAPTSRSVGRRPCPCWTRSPARVKCAGSSPRSITAAPSRLETSKKGPLAGAVVWRIARRRHALDRLGTGARQDGGRWNRVGTGIIYTGCTIAITALERFVHLAGVVPPDLVLVRVKLPDGHSAATPRLSDLPRDWDLVPAGPASMDFGTKWAQEQRSLVLYVPSAVLREETNALLN